MCILALQRARATGRAASALIVRRPAAASAEPGLQADDDAGPSTAGLGHRRAE